MRRLERELHTAQTTRGEAGEELRASYEKQLKLYERLTSSMQRYRSRPLHPHASRSPGLGTGKPTGRVW